MTTEHSGTLTLAKSGISQCSLDYLALAKPRVVMMILAVTTTGFYMGSTGTPDWLCLLHLNVGMALAAGGTLALNQYIERDWDALMQRTHLRPLPDARLHPTAALIFGLIMTIGGILYLTMWVRVLAGLITTVTTCSYLFLYTPLKRRTPLCLVVGALPGALPFVTGWIAADGTLAHQAWMIFAILFLWQLPHSLAIAWLYQEDYARAGFRLLPAVGPHERRVGRYIIMHCVPLLAVSLAPTVLGFTGWVYCVTMCLLGLVFLYWSIAAALLPSQDAIRRLVVVSLIYLPLALMTMVLDKIPSHHLP
jgi:heme o synthase